MKKTEYLRCVYWMQPPIMLFVDKYSRDEVEDVLIKIIYMLFLRTNLKRAAPLLSSIC